MNKTFVIAISSVIIFSTLSGCLKNIPVENSAASSEGINISSITPGTITSTFYQAPDATNNNMLLSISYANFNGGGSSLKATSSLPMVPLEVKLNEDGKIKQFDLNDKKVVNELISLVKMLKPLNDNQLKVKNIFLEQLDGLLKRSFSK
jgi:hypothetical protein